MWRAGRLRDVVLGFALLGFAPCSAYGQLGTRLTGYLEHQFSTNRTDHGWRLIDYDRARVDLSARAGRGVSASVAAVGQLYRGNTRVELRDFLPDDLDPLVDTASVTLDDQYFLNHAYVTFQPGALELIAGKQYLTWGAAWVFNPTELFRPKNPFEPTYEREGVAAISAKVSLGPLSDVQVALVPDGGFDTSGKLFRARHHLVGFDLSALVAVVHERQAPTAFDVPTDLERRFTVGGDVSGEILGLGVWAEATWSDHADERWVETAVGGNYTLGDGTLLLLEGYYNGRGEWDHPYSPSQWLARFSGDRRSLGKGLVYGLASRPFGQLWTLGMSALANVGDGSMVLIPSVAYAFAENVDLLFNGFAYVGADGAEFGTDTYGAFLRGRIYFQLFPQP